MRRLGGATRERQVVEDSTARESATVRHGRHRCYSLHLRLFGHFERVLDLDTQVSHGVFDLGMAKQELNHPQVLRAPVDQRRLCSPHGVGAVSTDILAGSDAA